MADGHPGKISTSRARLPPARRTAILSAPRDRSRFRQRGPEAFEQTSDFPCPLIRDPLNPLQFSEICSPDLASLLIDAVMKKMNASRRDTLSLSLRRVILNTIRNPSKNQEDPFVY